MNTSAHKTSHDKEKRTREAAEDDALIAKAQAGDMRAFRQLVERHQRRSFAVAFALVRDENDARDIAQEAFVRVFKHLPNFQGSSSFFTWLYRIITNLSIDLLRKPGRQHSELGEEDLPAADRDGAVFPLVSQYNDANPVDVLRRREIGDRLRTAIEALPSYHRAVIVLRELEGLSYEEMADALGVSKGTIMSRLFHARQKLQRALADLYEEQVGSTKPPGVEDSSGDWENEG